MKRLLLIYLFLTSYNQLAANPLDSIGLERRNGKMCIIHKVQAGETLRQLARRYKTSLAQLFPYNTNLDSNFVRIGQLVYIASPHQPTSSPQKNTTSQPTFHTIKAGETLTKLATFYKKDLDSLLLWNKLDRNTILTLGQSVIVGYNPVKSIVTETMVTTMEKRKVRHEIGKGERISTNSTAKHALHRTFPIGSMVLLVNPTNRLSVQVKIIGKIPDIDTNKDILIKVSDAACKVLGIVNDRFAIELVYEKTENK